MTTNQVLISSDHHANWDALEKLFQIANEKKIPFIVNGDIIGDYNFEELVESIGLKFPSQIEKDENKINLAKEDLKRVYEIIISEHAKRFAKLIDKYNVKTYFLLGNHEPINFIEITSHYLKNKELLIDLGKANGYLEIDRIKFAAVPNVNGVMPFLYEIYSEKELDLLFPHQRESRQVLTQVNKETLKENPVDETDTDFLRFKEDWNSDLDVFISHGQIGKGAWNSQRYASEVPTLTLAAHLSMRATLTIDGHLHTSHEMLNPLDKKTIRGVGNTAFLLHKSKGELKHEKVVVDAHYDFRGGMSFEEYKYKFEFFFKDKIKKNNKKIDINKIDFSKLAPVNWN